MKRLVIALLSAAMMTSVVLPSQASNPLGTYNTVDTVIPPSTASWGLPINESLTGGNLNTFSAIYGVRNYINSKLCKSTRDPHCEDMDSLSIQLVLPACTDAASRMCIEGLEVQKKHLLFLIGLLVFQCLIEIHLPSRKNFLMQDSVFCRRKKQSFFHQIHILSLLHLY